MRMLKHAHLFFIYSKNHYIDPIKILSRARPELVEGFSPSALEDILQQVQDERDEEFYIARVNI